MTHVFERTKRILGYAVPVTAIVLALLLLKFPDVLGVSADKVTLILVALIGLDFLLERLVYLESIPKMHESLSRLEALQNSFGYRGTFGSTEDLIRAARIELTITGLNLNALTNHVNLLEERARAGVRINLLAVQPDARLVSEIAQYFGEHETAFLKKLEANLSVLHARLQVGFPDQVSLKVSTFRPSFGYAACDPDSPNGFIRIESYTCDSAQSTRPMMQFRRMARPAEFSLYIEDMRKLLGKAIAYEGVS